MAAHAWWCLHYTAYSRHIVIGVVQAESNDKALLTTSHPAIMWESLGAAGELASSPKSGPMRTQFAALPLYVFILNVHTRDLGFEPQSLDPDSDKGWVMVQE